MPPVTPLLVTRASARVRPVGALWRLRGYLRPFRFQMIVMFAAAIGAVAAEITIPLLIKAVIDGAIAHGYRQLLVPLALAAIGLGTAEALLNLIRRWIQADAVASMEKTIRDDLYAHTCSGCRPRSTTTGSRVSCCPGPRLTCRRSAGSPGSA